MKGLFDAIRREARACPNGDKPRIAIGVVKDTPKLRMSLKKGSRYADLVVVGVQIPGYACEEASGSDDEIAAKLIWEARKGHVQGIVRGQLDYSAYHRVLNRFYKLKRDVMCASLMRSTDGHEWLMTPVVHDHDSSISGRCYLVHCAARICTRLGCTPKIGILCADDERGYMHDVDRDHDEALTILSRLQNEGISNVSLFPFRIDTAIKECNVVIPMNGILGNFVFRALCYVENATVGGAFSLTRKLISIDTTRFGDAFSIPIESAAAIANIGGLPVEEYVPGKVYFEET